MGPATTGIERAAAAGAADVLAALTALRGEGWVDPERILLVGHSMGGFAVLAAGAAQPKGVKAVISFAGAVGSPRPDFVCQPERLIAADRRFGLTAAAPSLWVFAENDHFFGPALARQMIQAYGEAGAKADLYMAPPFGADGHLLIYGSPATVWWPRVAAFLAANGLPFQPVMAPPTLPDLPVPAVLDEAGQRAFAVYRGSWSLEKAFAVDPLGHFGAGYGRRTRSEAVATAMRSCQISERVCRVYAVGNVVQPR